MSQKLTKSELKKKALKYHAEPMPGKLDIVATKPFASQEDLSLAYSPGVAYPSLEIAKDVKNSYKYTGKGNTVAVISDGTAVLGLGDIGGRASMPVMEGKAILLKRFAGISGVPIILEDAKDPKEIIRTVRLIQHSFGAINLEDIKAPECFEIEEALQDADIPVFHDDQHGTAVISTAGLLNSLEIVGKKIDEVKIVINGAGAAGIACGKMYLAAGAKKKNIFMLDSQGVISQSRKKSVNKYKAFFANGVDADLAEAIKDADVFVGVSVADILTGPMVKSMANDPIVFALANPNPEITLEKAQKYGVRIIATGRSDYPNQVNNVLGFPGIFRGALDTRSETINEEMKLAASKALYELTKETIPAKVRKQLEKIYPQDAKKGMFGKEAPLSDEYIIPKPFDSRVVPRVARYVAQAAMKTKVAKVKIKDLDKYEKDLFDI